MATKISSNITEVYTKVKENIGKVIVGKSDTVDISINPDRNELKNVFRADEITNTSNREALLKNAETNDGTYISVPKIMGGNR